MYSVLLAAIANRQSGQWRGGDHRRTPQSILDMGTEAEEKSAALSAEKRHLRVRVTVFAAAVGALLLTHHETHDLWMNNGATISNTYRQGTGDEGHGIANLEGFAVDSAMVAPVPDPLSHLENCTISFQPLPGSDKWTTKPLWFPSHPNTIEDSLHRKLISGITGLSAGGKSFYASSKAMKLKQCAGQTETATCSNVHPIVDMGNKHPDTRADMFFTKYILGLRNPATTLPAFHNGKAIKYHGLCDGCQVPENEWRKHRDEWLTDMLKEWTNFIATWKKMKKYKVGMYMVYEHLFDPIKGPATVQRLASLLRDAGFATAPDNDIPCIWHRTLGEDTLKAYHRRAYEYEDYIPGYTATQRDMLSEQLNILAEEQANDAELVGILRGYQDEIRALVRIDTEWNNETTNQRARK